MLIAHIPAGYITTRYYNRIAGENISFSRYGLLFSIWPDFDLLYFYLVDKKATFHHLYFTHIPLSVVIAFVFIVPIYLLDKSKKLFKIYLLFLISWFLHLILDTLTGGIAWLYPLKSSVIKLIEIPSQHSNWIVNFVFHWSFLIEISITAWAVILLFADKSKHVSYSKAIK